MQAPGHFPRGSTQIAPGPRFLRLSVPCAKSDDHGDILMYCNKARGESSSREKLLAHFRLRPSPIGRPQKKHCIMYVPVICGPERFNTQITSTFCPLPFAPLSLFSPLSILVFASSNLFSCFSPPLDPPRLFSPLLFAAETSAARSLVSVFQREERSNGDLSSRSVLPH